MKSIRIIGFIVGFIIFVVLFVIINIIANVQNGDGKKQEIIIAEKEIPAMTVITSDMLTTKEVSLDAVDANNILDKEQAIGMVANTKILANEPILKQKLTSTDNSVLGIAPTIKDGMRAVSIVVDIGSGLSGLLRTGNFVDVVATFESMPDTSNIQNSISFSNGKSLIIAQNAKVIALGQLIDADKQAQQANTSEKQEVYGTVTVEVTPEQAMSISLVESTEKTKIMLVLRSQSDSKVLDMPGRTW